MTERALEHHAGDPSAGVLVQSTMNRLVDNNILFLRGLEAGGTRSGSSVAGHEPLLESSRGGRD